MCNDSLGITGGATTQASNFHLYQIMSCAVIVVFGVGVPSGFLLYIYCTTRDVDESVYAAAADGRENTHVDQTDSIGKRMAMDLDITEQRARATFREISMLSNMSNLTEAYNPKYPCEQSRLPPRTATSMIRFILNASSSCR